MPKIPEQLKWYTPLKLDTSTGRPNWRVSVDEMTGSVEIERAPLLKLVTMLLGIVLGVIVSGGFFVAGKADLVDIESRLVWLFFFPLLIVFVIVAFDAFYTKANSRYWKGSLRFRFDPQNDELFFARENVTYRKGDYSKLVLGCVRGVDMKGAFKIGIAWAKLGNHRGRSFVEITQIFMLVLDKNDQWQRYNLADDDVTWRTSESGSKQFMQVAEQLECVPKHQPFIFQ